MSNIEDNEIYKKIYWILFVVIALLVLPIWYIGRYDVISLDDFGFGAVTHHAWIDTGSVREVFVAACEQVKYLYNVKQATYSSIFLMSFFPGIWEEKYYFLVPFILSASVIGAVTAFIHVLFSDCIGSKNRYITGIINMLVIFLIIQTVPVPLEAFFWFNGSVHYMFMESVLIIEISLILHGIKTPDTKARVVCIVISSILGIIVGGGNLITGLQACILVMIHICLMICCRLVSTRSQGFLYNMGIRGTERSEAVFLIPEIITVVGYLINISAPGNYQRMGVETQMNPVKAIIMSVYWGITHGVTWIGLMFAVIMIVVLSLAFKSTEGTNRNYLNPVMMCVVSICVFAAMLTPTFYATSEDAPARVKNIIYFAEIMLFVINIVNDAGYINSRNSHPYKTTSQNRTVIIGLICTLIIFVFVEDKNTYTSISAIRSILNGEAARYYEQSIERAGLYNDESKRDIVIYALTEDAKPYLLFKEDIGNYEGEEGYWQNVSISKYYRKDSITVINDGDR